MTLNDKFKHLRELTLDQIDTPTHVMLTHAVCSGEDTSCGWQGWIIEAVSGKIGFLPADTRQRCPECPSTLYRTERMLFAPSEDQNMDDWYEKVTSGRLLLDPMDRNKRR